jgi:exodeoxyribonuclease VII large subunit
MITPSIDLPVLSVSGLTQSIKLLLEGQFKFVSVQGEISNCKLQSSGHLYFSLKDAQSQIGAVMFKGDLASVDSIPKDGDQVIVKGAVNVYAPSGRYQIVVRSMEKAGLGALLLQLEALKAKLKAQGYFDAARKKPLPKFPKTIGVVTSPTGAVIQDILNVLTRRISGFHLILNPVKVQGPGAAQEIASAIDFFNRHQLADVLIVGRGGGSLEDLWAFNEEAVIQAIYNSKIPIVSAVGHETDFTLADFVADVRAPTPSAAAELVVQEKGAELQKLAQMQRGIRQGL